MDDPFALLESFFSAPKGLLRGLYPTMLYQTAPPIKDRTPPGGLPFGGLVPPQPNPLTQGLQQAGLPQVGGPLPLPQMPQAPTPMPMLLRGLAGMQPNSFQPQAPLPSTGGEAVPMLPTLLSRRRGMPR